MSQRPNSALLPPTLAAVVLIAFGLSGLMSGVLARGFVSSLQPQLRPTPVARTTRTPTHASATPTRTLVPPTGPFRLVLTSDPLHPRTGAAITLTARASTDAGGPAAGLPCSLGPASRGTPLLQQWPAPVTTDAAGVAVWHVTAPSDAGQYNVEVDAKVGGHQASWVLYISVG